MAKKPSKAAKMAKRKEKRRAYNNAANNGGGNNVALCADFKDALATALQEKKVRSNVVKITGLPFNTLARIASGRQAARPHEVKRLHEAADVIGFQPPQKTHA